MDDVRDFSHTRWNFHYQPWKTAEPDISYPVAPYFLGRICATLGLAKHVPKNEKGRISMLS